jgi:hypothetical protein
MAFLSAAIALVAGIWSLTVTGDQGIEATYRWEPFSNAYVVELANLPAPPQVEPAPANAPSGPGLDGLYGVLQHFFPEQPQKAWRVVECETGGTMSTEALAGPFRYDGRIVYYVGLFQVDPGIHGPVPKDAWGQAAQGRAIYDKAGGWSPWPICGRR